MIGEASRLFDFCAFAFEGRGRGTGFLGIGSGDPRTISRWCGYVGVALMMTGLTMGGAGGGGGVGGAGRIGTSTMVGLGALLRSFGLGGLLGFAGALPLGGGGGGSLRSILGGMLRRVRRRGLPIA